MDATINLLIGLYLFGKDIWSLHICVTDGTEAGTKQLENNGEYYAYEHRMEYDGTTTTNSNGVLFTEIEMKRVLDCMVWEDQKGLLTGGGVIVIEDASRDEASGMSAYPWIWLPKIFSHASWGMIRSRSIGHRLHPLHGLWENHQRFLNGNWFTMRRRQLLEKLRWWNWNSILTSSY